MFYKVLILYNFDMHLKCFFRDSTVQSQVNGQAGTKREVSTGRSLLEFDFLIYDTI